MPRLFPVFLFILFGCAHGVDDPMPEFSSHIEAIPRYQKSPSIEIECELGSISALEQCKLYTFSCSSGIEYLLICPLEYAIGELEEVGEPYGQ